jgi:hypothetical protein
MITDEQLETDFNYWLDHYIKNGDKHYSNTPDWKIIDLYYDNIVERVLENYSEEETDEVIERLSKMF